jgi:Fic family protein
MYKINPDRTIPWNDLPELPIEKELYYSVEVLEMLVEAKAALARLQGRSAAIPNQGILINTISLQEAKASSAVENIFTTDDELYKAYSMDKTDTVDAPAKEILRYREALWTGMKDIRKKELFDEDYYVKIYREIKQTNDKIRPPFAQVVIRQGGSGPNAGNIIYTPPRGKGIVDKKLKNLLNFMNDDETYKVDPILKMAIGHYQFEAIHPFRDGNGRTGRVFNIHYITKKGLLDLPVLFLSRYIIENKDEYYRRLSSVSQQGDWKNWILFMLRAVRTTSTLTYNKINDIISAKNAILSAIEGETNIIRPEQIVEMIFVQPYTKVKHFTDKEIYAENTARNYLNKLSEMGILEKKTIQGHHYYLNLELSRILSE